MERFKGWFINNRVSRLDYSGVFLPFWTFDIYGSALIRDAAEDQPAGLPPQKLEVSEQVRNAFIPGVTSPPRKALLQIADYDPGEAIAYTPKLLAKFAAELYQIEFDRASLDARERFREHVTRRHKNPNPDVRRTIFSQVDHMDMRLLLLPVWVVTVTEDDGDKRLALFNGQTGRFVLGRARPATR